MTEEQAIEYFTSLARQSGLTVDDPNFENFVTTCVNLGLRAFWNAAYWKFRTRSDTIDVSGDPPYDMPDDFDALRSLRENDSTPGWSLTFMDKSEFDRQYPKPSVQPAGTPAVVTIYKDDGQWKFQTMPIPDIDTAYIDYYASAPNTLADVPDKYMRGAFLFIEELLYKPGSAERLQVHALATAEIERLRTLEGPMGDIGDKMLTEADIAEPGLGVYIPGVFE